MTIEFGPKIQGNRRGELQQWIEAKVDRNTDFFAMAISQVPGDRDYIREDWHQSPGDPQRHLTGDVFHGGQQVGTVHAYENGQVVMFPSSEA